MEGCVYATFFGGPDQFLVLKGRLNNRKIGYGPVKNEQTGTDQWLFRFRGYRRLWPQYLKKHGSIPIPKKHDTHSLHEQKCEVRTPFSTGPYPIFLSCKRAFCLSAFTFFGELSDLLFIGFFAAWPRSRKLLWVGNNTWKVFWASDSIHYTQTKSPRFRVLGLQNTFKRIRSFKNVTSANTGSDTDLQQFSTWESRLTTSFSFSIHISHIFATYTWSLRLLFRQCGCVALMKGYQTVEARKRYLKQSALLCMTHWNTKINWIHSVEPGFEELLKTAVLFIGIIGDRSHIFGFCLVLLDF